MSNKESQALYEQMQVIKADIQSIKELVESIRKLGQGLEALFNSNGIAFNDISSVIKDAKNLSGKIIGVQKGIPEWKGRLQIISDKVPMVADVIAENAFKENVEILKTDLKALLDDSYQGFHEESQKTVNVIDTFMKVVGNDATSGMLALGAEDPVYIHRPIDDLKPAELDLRFSGITLGDHVSMTADFRPVDDDDDMLKPPAVTYSAETTLAGWHRRYDGNVIFSSTLEGPASHDFKSNVAVSLEWHHYDRNDPNSFLNKLDVGFGFHSSFLDQDFEENVELGGGVNISVLDGLIRVGAGYNITASENNEYWFVGFGLFGLLGQVSDLGGGFKTK